MRYTVVCLGLDEEEAGKKILRAFRIGEERDLPVSIEFILNVPGLACLL
jgi:hypothetical protein